MLNVCKVSTNQLFCFSIVERQFNWELKVNGWDSNQASSVVVEGMYWNEIDNLILPLKDSNLYTNYEFLQLWDELYKI